MTVRLEQTTETPAGTAGAESSSPVRATRRRGILLRDSLILLALCSVAVALFGITLFLFKSFEGHREDLARRWSRRGRVALTQHHPADAAEALRIALSYAPDDRQNQLLLAQALAQSGRLDAATNYFLSLWDAQPGDGFVNLQLARLARQQGDAPAAINYYQAAIFGNWEGDGVMRRRDVRLELADYLSERNEIAAARSDLLIAAGNAREKDAEAQIEIADRLQAIGDLSDALHSYQVAVAAEPHNGKALERAGNAAYALGNFGEAYRMFSDALQLERHKPGQGFEDSQLATLAYNAHRAPELNLTHALSPEELGQHLRVASGIAERRLKSCLAAQPAPHPGDTSSASVQKTGASSGEAVDADAPASTVADPLLPVLQALKGRWMEENNAMSPGTLERDAVLQDSLMQLVDDTEQQTAKACGAPTGDDAVLLMLALRGHGGAQ